jgi:hypothetical protein
VVKELWIQAAKHRRKADVLIQQLVPEEVEYNKEVLRPCSNKSTVEGINPATM